MIEFYLKKTIEKFLVDILSIKEVESVSSNLDRTIHVEVNDLINSDELLLRRN